MKLRTQVMGENSVLGIVEEEISKLEENTENHA